MKKLKLSNEKLHEYGYLYYTQQITIKKIAEDLEINQSTMSKMISDLVSDPDFDVSWCNRQLVKQGKMPPKPKGKILPPYKPASEEKIPYSNNEDDYATGNSSWRDSLPTINNEGGKDD